MFHVDPVAVLDGDRLDLAIRTAATLVVMADAEEARRRTDAAAD